MKPKFSKETLRKHCQALFGVPTEVFDGAFFNHEAMMTKEEAQRKINRFLKKEVN